MIIERLVVRMIETGPIAAVQHNAACQNIQRKVRGHKSSGKADRSGWPVWFRQIEK
jgi:hypothetical protein